MYRNELSGGKLVSAARVYVQPSFASLHEARFHFLNKQKGKGSRVPRREADALVTCLHRD